MAVCDSRRFGVGVRTVGRGTDLVAEDTDKNVGWGRHDYDGDHQCHHRGSCRDGDAGFILCDGFYAATRYAHHNHSHHTSYPYHCYHIHGSYRDSDHDNRHYYDSNNGADCHDHRDTQYNSIDYNHWKIDCHHADD